MSDESEARLDGLNFVVRDMDATLAFYRRLGVDIPEESLWRSGGEVHHVELKLPGGFGLDFDSAALARSYNAGYEESGAASQTLVGFRVSSRGEVDARYADLTSAGHKGLQPPYDVFWGARYSIVEDPDGRPIGIMSPVDPTRRTRPPDL